MASQKEIEGSRGVITDEQLESEENGNDEGQKSTNPKISSETEGGQERWADQNKAKYGDKHVVKRYGGGKQGPKPKGIHTNVTSDLPCLKKPTKENTKKYREKAVTPAVSKSPKIQTLNVGASASAALDMIDTIDRKGDATANATYARSGTFADFSNEPGKRIPKAGAFAEAGVGEAKAAFSIFEAAAKGPNAGACAMASATGVRAMATAGIGTASAQAGPIGVKVGLSLDTGVSAGVDGIEAKFAGIGFSIGPKTSVSFLGNEVSCCIS